MDVPWHVARDGIAEVGFVVASISSTCVRIAREVTDLARTELGEVREPLGPGRGASSTMPQKANPILSEAVIGMGTIALSQLPAMLAAMHPRHERATGEWQVEWDVLPTLCCLAAGCLAAIGTIIEGLVVDERRMHENLDRDGGLIMAEALMMALAPITGRAEAHHLMYDLSARARRDGRRLRDVVAEELPADLAARLPPVGVLLILPGTLARHRTPWTPPWPLGRDGGTADDRAPEPAVRHPRRPGPGVRHHVMDAHPRSTARGPRLLGEICEARVGRRGHHRPRAGADGATGWQPVDLALTAVVLDAAGRPTTWSAGMGRS